MYDLYTITNTTSKDIEKMGNTKNAIIGFGVLVVIIAAILGIMSAVYDSEDQEKSTSLHTPQEVENLVKDYKGKDNSGQTLSEIITMLVITAYPGEDILENPSTDWGFSAMPMSGDPDIDRRWDAEFYLKTYRENTRFEWSVDMETKSIYAKNELGKSVLDALDTYD